MYQINNKGNWINLKRFRLEYPAITGEDVKLKEGDETDICAWLQKRFSKTEDEIISMINKVKS